MQQMNSDTISSIIKHSPIEEIKQLFNSSNVNPVSFYDISPLYIAIKNERKDVVEYFISQGAKIDMNAFIPAIGRDDLSIFRTLLEHRGYILPEEYQNILLEATYMGDIRLIEFLTRKNIIFRIKGGGEKTTMLIKSL